MGAVAGVLLATGCGALAGGAASTGSGQGWVTTHPLVGGAVALTNRQANAVWVPVAVLWKFNDAAPAVVTVERVSQGNTFLLGALGVSNATSVVWVPDAAYPFAQGDALRVTSSTTNGQVQVIRRGE